ncbi:MAG: hypothetical protein ACRD3W_27230 [Terriglobales bacterium]
MNLNTETLIPPDKIKLWICAALLAYPCAGLVYYFCHFVSNSYSASGIVALTAFLGLFLLFIFRAKESTAAILNPEPMLFELSPVRILAEVKDALVMKYFGDKNWRLDNLNEAKGTAMFVFKPEKETREDTQKKHTIVLLARSTKLSRASSLDLNYEIVGATLGRDDALKLCLETSAFIETHMNQAITAIHQ